MSAPNTSPASRSTTTGLLGFIERAGNLLPHPVLLFAILSALLAVASWVLSALGVSAVSPASGKLITAQNLISDAGLQMIVGDLIENFMSFPPLGTALVVMLGVAIADKSGLLNTVIRASLSRVSPRWVTFVLAFVAMFAHVGADAAYIVLIPLGGVVFRAAGRSPVLGIVVALVAISGGSAASPILIPNDAILAGLAEAAAHTIDPAYVVSPAANYFFSAVSSVVLAAVITLVVETYLAKRVDARSDDDADRSEPGAVLQLTSLERRGVRNAGIAALGFLVVLVLATIPPSSPLRGEDGSLLDSLLVTNIAVFLAIFFGLVGIAFGVTVGEIKTVADVPSQMAAGLRDMAPILVLFFVISQFLAYFKWTKLGELLALHGAEVLRAVGAHGVLLFGGMLIVISVINLFVTSGSAQWALVAPVFVPMFMLLNIPPETTLALYRIADSCTNVITPMSPYFIMALGFVQKHRKDAGIGTLAAMTTPLAAAMFIAWTALFFAWWALDIPFGFGGTAR